MMKRVIGLLVLLTMLDAPSALGADRREHVASITMSPLHLFLPVIEVTGEYRLSPKVGLAGVLGGGTSNGMLLTEQGAQFRWYPVGSFQHGMQLGAEVLAATASSGGVTGVGVGAGPFIGYKIIAGGGFTFETQLGPSFLFASGPAGSQGDVAPLLNINFGWSI